MRVLAIDTATTALVTGVVDTVTGQTTGRVLEDTRAHNELLIPTITAVSYTHLTLPTICSV